MVSVPQQDICKPYIFTHSTCYCRCQHHFHKDCLHEWLALNSMCPMCKRDSRGKEYEVVEEEDD
jgi:hypothetical protein